MTIKAHVDLPIGGEPCYQCAGDCPTNGAAIRVHHAKLTHRWFCGDDCTNANIDGAEPAEDPDGYHPALGWVFDRWPMGDMPLEKQTGKRVITRDSAIAAPSLEATHKLLAEIARQLESQTAELRTVNSLLEIFITLAGVAAELSPSDIGLGSSRNVAKWLRDREDEDGR